jgi:lysophospholipase L1-like esterase
MMSFRPAGLLVPIILVGLTARGLAQPAVPAPVKKVLPRFEADILAFEELDKKTPPPANPILFVGSSTFTRWHELAADFPKLPVLNRGFGGSTMADLNRYIDRIVIPYHPSQIVVYEGSNDIASAKATAEQVLTAIKTFHVKVHAALPETQIHFLSIIPAPSRVKYISEMDRANNLIREYVLQHKELHFIDARYIWSDGGRQPDMEWYIWDRLHPNREGYEKLIPLIRAAIAPGHNSKNDDS